MVKDVVLEVVVGLCNVPEAWYLLESTELELIGEVAAPEKVA